MSRERSELEVIPNAKRLINSLRDMGYDFAAAVADLVDNSIEAEATLVKIDIEFDGDDSWVRIADNGTGMKPAVLREAMRYGSDREYADDDLGKFGLGMKVASLSQCRRLTVASRTSRERAEIVAYSWDLEHIENTNKWELVEIPRERMSAALRDPLVTTTGTVVLWERLDRMLGYQFPYGEHARKRLLSMCRDAEEYLAMVFHRFLAGEAKTRKKKIRVFLNGNEVKPWDPFARSEINTKQLPPVPIRFDANGTSGYVVLEPYVLPHQSKFSSADAFRSASGPSNWNQQQGFYIYRADRLIQSGGWCRLRTVDEHTKLARIALKFSPQLDEAFKVNVAKMRVQLPPQIKDQIDHALKPVIRAAQEAYRKEKSTESGAGNDLTPTKPAVATNGRGTNGDNNPIVKDQSRGAATPDQRVPDSAVYASGYNAFGEVVGKLMAAATPAERVVIERVAQRVSTSSSKDT